MYLYGQKHIERYRATDGAEGHDWRGTQTLLLTTTGRKSGEPRTAPLIYGRSWYRNLEAHPEVEVQVKDDRFRARARDATPEERPEMWREMVRHCPSYDDYQARTVREIPVVVLERI